ncbi:MAG: hypothetical protein KKE02_06050 [Alphaproteobacteria bacterium]|nr:hypothetical protein [Alphaproteobacteria bacterium]MBU1512879.1 hypothetical protein [Alphaproteobacteria bacterium]MBU2096680.1 hypothetical protein [Alphaproteobacteria bacterium]MBU2150563.1 hypothetical protein [Alphaproteobacteria bacterium]MBU2308061.1 hypothetical protein [Alphaproteobacteria bacterium]
MRLAALALCLWLAGGSALAQPAPAADNGEMQRIFQEDQADRKAPVGTIDWKVIRPRDEQRRLATRKLLADGALRTADDFHAAAFVFQHGHEDDDYLLAHTLAMIAVAKGRKESLWIASATLDRYLVQVGKPQVYGTQFSGSKVTGGWTQEPYNRDLISDSIRVELGVPSLAEQARQMADLPTLMPAPKKP